MEEYSRPATLADLKALIGSLNRQGAEYLLIGGYALFAHGYHRATTDIDVLVPATRQAGERIKEALMVLPDQSATDIDPAWFEEGENIRVADAFVVDILLNACGETYETLEPFAETIDLDGLPIRTINLEGTAADKTDHAGQGRGRPHHPGAGAGGAPKAFPRQGGRSRA
jgi:hypothetical protein